LFERLGRYVVAHPWRIIATWVIAVAVIVPFAPSLASVSSSDQTSFLPSSYESVRAQKLADKAFPESSGASAIFIVERGDGHKLTPSNRREIGPSPRDSSTPGSRALLASPPMRASRLRTARPS